jgi:2-amino-4-hydroxy-6-hydroxymethyldihydropteridine diphosphokinase
MNSTTEITAYIGLGSNLADPLSQLKKARLTIAGLAQVQELDFSSFYHSAPVGPQDQPDYVNAVMAISTNLAALDLLHCLQKIELEQGRVRTGERWGARTLDLDLLLYGEQQINLPELIVPHPEISNRAFVLYPLQEIAPALVLPILGAIEHLIAQCPAANLKKLP